LACFQSNVVPIIFALIVNELAWFEGDVVRVVLALVVDKLTLSLGPRKNILGFISQGDTTENNSYIPRSATVLTDTGLGTGPASATTLIAARRMVTLIVFIMMVEVKERD
jgi:hypothetical protein